MDYARSPEPPAWPPVPPPVPPRLGPGRPPVPVKIIIAGGFGVGKTTTVGAISEIPPLTTEAEMTSAAVGLDDPTGVPDKTTTTVALDFGRVTIDERLKLYLFGTPGQARFGFMWVDLARGSLGALVIVDSGRLDDCFPAVDYFEHLGLPFVVAVNAFDGRLAHSLDEVRWALVINPKVPVVRFDARDRWSVRDTLLVLLELALDRATRGTGRHASQPAGPGPQADLAVVPGPAPALPGPPPRYPGPGHPPAQPAPWRPVGQAAVPPGSWLASG